MYSVSPDDVTRILPMLVCIRRTVAVAAAPALGGPPAASATVGPDSAAMVMTSRTLWMRFTLFSRDGLRGCYVSHTGTDHPTLRCRPDLTHRDPLRRGRRIRLM